MLRLAHLPFGSEARDHRTFGSEHATSPPLKGGTSSRGHRVVAMHRLGAPRNGVAAPRALTLQDSVAPAIEDEPAATACLAGPGDRSLVDLRAVVVDRHGDGRCRGGPKGSSTTPSVEPDARLDLRAAVATSDSGSVVNAHDAEVSPRQQLQEPLSCDRNHRESAALRANATTNRPARIVHQALRVQNPRISCERRAACRRGGT